MAALMDVISSPLVNGGESHTESAQEYDQRHMWSHFGCDRVSALLDELSVLETSSKEKSMRTKL